LFNLGGRDEYLSFGFFFGDQIFLEIVNFLEIDRLGLAIEVYELNQLTCPSKLFLNLRAMCNEVVFPNNLSWNERICTFLKFGELKSAALCALDVFLFGTLLSIAVHINKFGGILGRLFGCLATGIHFVTHSSKYE
jgi:hypothetical protein